MHAPLPSVPAPDLPSRPHPRVWLLVLAGHLLLGLLLTDAMRAGRWRSEPAGDPPRISWLTLRPAPAWTSPFRPDTATAPADPDPAPRRRQQANAAPGRTAMRAPGGPVAESAAITPDLAHPVDSPDPASTTSSTTVSAQAAAAPAPPASVASAPVPLNLALPRHRGGPPPPAAAQVRDDPAVHPAPLSRDERLARQLGTDTTLRIQTLADGTQRLRQGTACTDVHPSRAQGLDPFNQTTHPLPRGADSCR